MKQCIGCAYAAWAKTNAGRLHSSGDGHCQFDVVMPVLPAAKRWGFSWDDSPPHPHGGWINRKDADRKPCPCRSEARQDAQVETPGSVDAELLEAVERCLNFANEDCPECCSSYQWTINMEAIDTLLDYVRAVQSPRLTEEQREAVKKAHTRLMAYACPNDEVAGEGLKAAFPEAFAGEVGK